MKRVFILALVVLMALSMCSVSAFADAAEEPDEAAAIAFNHKIYEANRLDTLFGRHESLTFSFVYPEEPGRTWFVWETSDCMYQEWGTQAAQLDRDRVVYAMNCDEKTGAVSVHCGVNVEPDYNPFYSFVRETEEAFFDPAHDHVTRIWEEDGAIHGASQFDETLSRDFVENELGLEYTGQTIRTEITLDAETYEILKNTIDAGHLLPEDAVQGIFYWEPCAGADFLPDHYPLGASKTVGPDTLQMTRAMEAFGDSI